MRRRYWVVLGVMALGVVAAGSSVAATKLASPSEQSKAIINDAAGRLHVAPSALSSALEQALDDQIDAALKAGRLTKQQADALKARVAKGQMPLVGGFGHHFGGREFGFGGRGFGWFGHREGMVGPGFAGGMVGAGLETVTSYLGITQAQLRTAVRSGKSLAQIATDNGKTADGLVAALVAATKSRLDEAVAAKHLTAAQENALLSKMPAFYKSLVDRTPHAWSQQMPPNGGVFGFGSDRRFWTPSTGVRPSVRPSAVPQPQL